MARQEDDGRPLLADGFEGALLGIGTRFTHTVAIYDYEKCVAILMRRDEMSREDAEEHMEFNVTGGYLGEHTPVFLRCPLEDWLARQEDE